MLVTTVPNTNGQQLVVAKPLSDVDSAARQLILTNVLVGLGVLTVIGSMGAAIVRTSLRPLTEIEQTAGAIAGGDLTRRVPEGDPRTEVGSLSQSLNAMLVAELADNAGWEMLIALVREAGHDRIATDFEKALVQEQDHLQKVKGLLESAVKADAQMGG